MARIDRFIQQLRKVEARQLVLDSDKKAALVTDDGEWPITSEVMSAAQIRSLLAEILPADVAAVPADARDLEFPYQSAQGAFLATLSQDGSSVRLVLKPSEGPPDDASQPRAVPAPAAPLQQSSDARLAVSSQSGDAPAVLALFRKMVSEGCSDLHLSTENPPLYRKDGDIVTLGNSASLSPEQVRELLLAITPESDRVLFDQHHDVDFSYEVPGLARFRCNLFMDRRGMGGVFRVIPTTIPTAEDLGLSQKVLELCHLNKGLIVVTGPTGSGKSTTLAAMVDYINRNLNGHLITIEDPIEFVHENRKCLINQREVGDHTDGFKAALRAALREDPDFVLVGELRDLETVAIAIETAETGHLVLGTLHTNTAPSAVDRMIDQFPTDRQAQVRTMLAESLRGVIAQVLCKKKGGGRVAAREVLIVNSAVSNLIREAKTFQIPSIMQAGKGLGMVCLNDALLDLVNRGLTEPMEAYGKAVSKTEFKGLLARAGVKVELAGAS